MKLFNKDHFLYDFRWYFLLLLLAAALMFWYDITGDRLFESNGQQQWSSSGAGYHK